MNKPLFTILLLWTFSSFTFSQTKTFVREYTYNAGEADSKITARANSLDQVKRLLLEEVGAYIESCIGMKKNEDQSGLKELTKEELLSVAAGVTETKVLDEKWTGESCYLKAEITLDSSDVLEKINRIAQDRSKVKELEEVKQKADEAQNEIEKLRKQLAEVKDEKGRFNLQTQYKTQSNNLDATDWFQKGYNASENKEYDDAILYYQKAIDLKPACPDAYINMGIAYSKKGNYDKAIGLCQKAIHLNPEDALAYINMGIAYGKKGNDDRAIELYDQAIDLNPKDAIAYYDMGVAFNHKGNFDKALELYKKAAHLGDQEAQQWLKQNGYTWEK